jgi:intracellular sulfur oxidation DsrE/DsrF family protein
MSQQKFSDEFLNAFVDGELAPEEKNRAYLEINQDEALSRQVCELRKLRDMVQFAYKNVPSSSVPAPVARVYLGNLAAGIALVLGIAIGWVLHTPPATSLPETTSGLPAATRLKPSVSANVPARPAQAGTAVTTRPAATPALAVSAGATATAPGEQVKVLIHVNDGHMAKLEQTLDEIEGLVNHYHNMHTDARVEVVINGEGLNLVRADVTAYAARIARMQKQYGNLVFAACQNTMERLKREQGIDARLLPGVTVIDSGVAQLMRRQQQGWAYIRV